MNLLLKNGVKIMKKIVVLLVTALSSITMLLATVVGVIGIGNISPLSASVYPDGGIALYTNYTYSSWGCFAEPSYMKCDNAVE